MLLFRIFGFLHDLSPAKQSCRIHYEFQKRCMRRLNLNKGSRILKQNKKQAETNKESRKTINKQEQAVLYDTVAYRTLRLQEL